MPITRKNAVMLGGVIDVLRKPTIDEPEPKYTRAQLEQITGLKKPTIQMYLRQMRDRKWGTPRAYICGWVATVNTPTHKGTPIPIYAWDMTGKRRDAKRPRRLTSIELNARHRTKYSAKRRLDDRKRRYGITPTVWDALLRMPKTQKPMEVQQ